MIKLIPYAEIQRDENGYWSHPDMDNIITGSEDEKWLSEQFKAVNHILHDLLSDENPELAEEIANTNDSYNISKWRPNQPVEGWHILSIHDSEDGPIAFWFKPKTKIELAHEIVNLKESNSTLDAKIRSIKKLHEKIRQQLS